MKFKNLLFRAQNHCEMEEEMATHFTILVWRIPWTEEPGGPQARESQNSQTQLSA